MVRAGICTLHASVGAYCNVHDYNFEPFWLPTDACLLLCSNSIMHKDVEIMITNKNNVD